MQEDLPEKFVEAMIFASDRAVSIPEIAQVLSEALDGSFDDTQVRAFIGSIRDRYDNNGSAIHLVESGGGYQFFTRKEYYTVVSQLQAQRSRKKLSQAALETLAIIAYRQPVTKLEIEQIRGVNCDYTVQKLLEKELIVISGKSDAIGRPLLYATSPLFMDYFGINSTSDLPQLKDLEVGDT